MRTHLLRPKILTDMFFFPLHLLKSWMEVLPFYDLEIPRHVFWDDYIGVRLYGFSDARETA